MKRTPKALVLAGDGLGGFRETALAFRLARFEVDIVAVGELLREKLPLDQLCARRQSPRGKGYRCQGQRGIAQPVSGQGDPREFLGDVVCAVR